MPQLDFLFLIQDLPSIVVGLRLHEFSHAYVSYLCGDRTAKEMGRISVNPIRHIDPLGFFFIILAGFWWAKPVVFDHRRLNNSFDAIKIALAGPLANALLALLFSGIFAYIVHTITKSSYDTYKVFIDIIYYGIYVNWGLFVFNMLPIPPLDWSHIFFSRYMDHPWYSSIYKYGTVTLFLILLIEWQARITILPIRPAVTFLSEFFLRVFGFE